MTLTLTKAPKQKKKARGVAMTDLQYQGLSLLARQEDHVSRSHIMQRLLDAELERKIGKDWKAVVAREASSFEEAEAA